MEITPTVSVILTTQLDVNAPYLHLALKGLAATTGIAYEVWLVSGTHIRPEAPELYLPHFHMIWDQRLDTATKKVERAFRSISPDSTHILHLSDDVIVTANTLRDLHSGFKGRDMIMNPLSNSDCRSLYEADLRLGAKTLIHDMTIDDFSDAEFDDLIEGVAVGKMPMILVPFTQVSFYCTMIPKSVYEKVGPLDPALEYRCDDQDLCWRAAVKGIPSVVNFSAFAFHFGSRTLRHMDTDHKKGDEALAHFKTKWNLT